MLRVLSCLAVVALLLTAPLAAADEKDAKPKENEKEKPNKPAVEWVPVFTVSNAPGGKQYFDLPKSGRVKFSWETTPNGQVPQLRVTVAKLNERTGSYQIIGTVMSVFTATKSSAMMDLTAGKYQLYIATKFMKYTLNVEQRK